MLCGYGLVDASLKLETFLEIENSKTGVDKCLFNF